MKGEKLSLFERRIEMLFFIMRNKRTTVPQLAEMFSICASTAYTDVTFLSKYVPIYTKNGLHGGVFMLDGYRNDLFCYLSKDEETVLRKLANQASGREKSYLLSVINRYAMPPVGI